MFQAINTRVTSNIAEFKRNILRFEDFLFLFYKASELLYVESRRDLRNFHSHVEILEAGL